MGVDNQFGAIYTPDFVEQEIPKVVGMRLTKRLGHGGRSKVWKPHL